MRRHNLWGDKLSEAKYDKDGNATHFKNRNPQTGEEEFLSIDDPSGSDYIGEKLKYGMNVPEIDKARKAAQQKYRGK